MLLDDDSSVKNSKMSFIKMIRLANQAKRSTFEEDEHKKQKLEVFQPVPLLPPFGIVKSKKIPLPDA